MSLRDALVTRLQSLPRRRPGRPVQVQEHTLTSGAGYRIATRLHRPARRGPATAVLLCPGTNDSGRVFEGWTQPLNAGELARRGFLVATFDPAGRGESWGPEDYGGLEHQDDVRAVLQMLADHSDTDRLVVVSISLGLAMAAGALAGCARDLGVERLIDWEGPCDREIITAGGRILTPALGHSLDDDFYWHPREATRHVGQLACGYHRIQSARDHAQPGEFRHAERMLRAAQSGALPWFRLNDHPEGQVPDTPEWIPPGRLAANKALLEALSRAR